MNDTKRFIVIFITSITFLFLIVTSLNYLVDPLNLFSDSDDKSLEAKLARTLAATVSVLARSRPIPIYCDPWPGNSRPSDIRLRTLTLTSAGP